MTHPTAAVWSLWTKPTIEGAYRSGWPTMRDHLLSWVLSVESARPHFAATRLVTDTPGAALLVNALGLAFDDVSTALDGLVDADPDLWALGKLHAYAAQRAPFLHIDSDVYLWTPPPPRVLEASVCAVYPEHRGYGEGMYRCASLKTDVRRVGGWLPEELDAHIPHGGMIRGENCGVLGGVRVDFLAHYAAQAIRLIEHPANGRAWARRRPMMADMLIFEQHMLSACLDYHRGRAGSAFADVAIGYLFGSEGEAYGGGGQAGFTHVISDSKRNPAVIARLADRVRREYPALYASCLALCGARAEAA